MILQYLSGLASPSVGRDQSIVTNFLAALDSRGQGRDPMFYLGIIQKMKGEWYNQEGEFWSCSGFDNLREDPNIGSVFRNFTELSGEGQNHKNVF